MHFGRPWRLKPEFFPHLFMVQKFILKDLISWPLISQAACHYCKKTFLKIMLNFDKLLITFWFCETLKSKQLLKRILMYFGRLGRMKPVFCNFFIGQKFILKDLSSLPWISDLAVCHFCHEFLIIIKLHFQKVWLRETLENKHWNAFFDKNVIWQTCLRETYKTNFSIIETDLDRSIWISFFN